MKTKHETKRLNQLADFARLTWRELGGAFERIGRRSGLVLRLRLRVRRWRRRMRVRRWRPRLERLRRSVTKPPPATVLYCEWASRESRHGRRMYWECTRCHRFVLRPTTQREQQAAGVACNPERMAANAHR